MSTTLPEAHPTISASTARALVRTQIPHLAHLPVGTRHDGWDMAMFRLGDTLAVRLPRTADGAHALEAELRLVARVSAAWTFPFPQVQHQGEPGHDYPWRWSVVTWLDGDIAAEVPLSVQVGDAIGEALAQIHVPVAADARFGDARFNDDQSVPLRARQDSILADVATLTERAGPQGERLDPIRTRTLWNAAMDAPDPIDTVWSHADLHGFNVLSDGGRFAGIIDWADIATCDRAVDLGFLFTLMPGAGVERAWRRYASLTGHGSDALWARARGVALHKCLDLAKWDRPQVTTMGWRGLVELGVAA